MAIAYETSNARLVNSTNTTENVSLTVSTGDIIVAFAADDNTGNTDSVTWNGTPLTSAGATVTDTGGFFKLWAWYLLAPAAGTFNLAFTRTTGGASDNWVIGGTVYSGSRQSGQPDAYTTQAVGAGTSLTTSLTTVANNAWTVLFAVADAGGLAASTGSTQRQNVASFCGIFDSNGPITPAGSTSMSVTMSNGIRTSIMLSIAPPSAAGGSRLMMMGVGT